MYPIIQKLKVKFACGEEQDGDDDTKESYRVLKSPLSLSDGGGGTFAIWGYSYNT
nr:4771_t:CDS:2 [Entrophospora candida]